MEQELIHRNAQFNAETHPYNKRANNFTWQSFLRKIEKKKICIFLFVEKGFCIIDYPIDNRSSPAPSTVHKAIELVAHLCSRKQERVVAGFFVD
jgi:hypothetical protein